MMQLKLNYRFIYLKSKNNKVLETANLVFLTYTNLVASSLTMHYTRATTYCY